MFIHREFGLRDLIGMSVTRGHCNLTMTARLCSCVSVRNLLPMASHGTHLSALKDCVILHPNLSSYSDPKKRERYKNDSASVVVFGTINRTMLYVYNVYDGRSTETSNSVYR